MCTSSEIFYLAGALVYKLLHTELICVMRAVGTESAARLAASVERIEYIIESRRRWVVKVDERNRGGLSVKTVRSDEKREVRHRERTLKLAPP